MSKVWQEFYCTKSGGGCGGYILVKLNMAINQTVEIVCPKCNHKHQRCIEGGQIKERGRFNNSPVEEICPTMAAYHTLEQGPWTKIKRTSERDGAVINGPEDLVERDPALDAIIKESWFERHAGKLM